MNVRMLCGVNSGQRLFFRVIFVLMICLMCISFTSGQDKATLPRPIHILAGHDGWVNRALFSPDGQMILTVSEDTTAILWNTQTGEKLFTLLGHTEGIIDAAFSPDGQTVVTGSTDDDAILWDVQTGEQRHLLSLHRDDISAVAFSPDGQSVVTASLDESATVWDVETGEYVAILSGHKRAITDVAFSPDGTTILTGSSDYAGRLWNARTGRRLYTLTGHKREVTAVAFSPDGTQAITAGQDTNVIFWDVQTGEKVKTLHEDDILSVGVSISALALSPDGTLIFTGSRQDAVLWDIEVETMAAVFTDHKRYDDTITSVAFSPDSTMILSASEDDTALLMDVQSRIILQIFNSHTDDITSAVFSPDGQTVLTASHDGTAMLWDIRNVEGPVGLASKIISPSRVFPQSTDSLVFAPDGETFTAHMSNSIVRWEVATGRKRHAFRFNVGGERARWIVVFSPDQTMVLTATSFGDQAATVWDLQSGKRLYTLGESMDIDEAIFSPDGTMFITLNESDTILWDTKTGEPIRIFKGEETSAAFSPDGQLILTGGASKLQLWDIQTGELVRTFTGHSYNVLELAFSPDGRRIATYSGDSFPQVFDTQTGELLYTLDVSSYSKLTMIFLPDGKTLLTSTIFEGSTKLWDARTGEFLRAIAGSEAVMSPDGHLVVTGLDNGWGLVSDVASGEVLHILRGQRFFLHTAFSPDSKTILTSGAGTGVALWDISGEE